MMMTLRILETVGRGVGMGELGAQGGGEGPTGMGEEVEEWEH